MQEPFALPMPLPNQCLLLNDEAARFKALTDVASTRILNIYLRALVDRVQSMHDNLAVAIKGTNGTASCSQNIASHNGHDNGSISGQIGGPNNVPMRLGDKGA